MVIKEKLSIIIPIYNSSSFIRDTLESVQKSCIEYEYEIILVDDVSDDLENVKYIIEAFNFIKLIEKRVKTNAAHSRNIGFLESRYSYVFFLDSDDLFTPAYVRSRIQLMSIHQSGVFFGGYTEIKKDGRNVKHSTSYSNNCIRDYLFKEHGDFRSSTISINKDFHKGTLFDAEMKKHQDWGFAIKCSDGNESLFYDKNTHVFINCAGEQRMSAKLNICASQYFLDNYVNEKEHINYFIGSHILQALCSADFNAMQYFLFKLRENGSDKNNEMNYRLYHFLSRKYVIIFSSVVISQLRILKAFYKKYKLCIFKSFSKNKTNI